MSDNTGGSAPHAILRDLTAAQDLAGGAPRRSRTYALVIAGVVCISAGAIFAMRQMGLKAGLDLSKATIKYEPKSVVSSASFERVLIALEASGNPVQIPPEAIRIDPFALEAKGPDTSSGDRAQAEAERARQKALEEEQRRLAARANDIQTRLQRMQLISIMGGRHPLANINGNLVQIGDVIEEHFTVIAIEGSKVILEADGTRYELTPGGLDAGRPRNNR